MTPGLGENTFALACGRSTSAVLVRPGQRMMQCDGQDPVKEGGPA